jgi:hypothetical protein
VPDQGSGLGAGLFGWLLQRQVTKKLAIGGELFHQTVDMIGSKDTTGFNIGVIYDLDKSQPHAGICRTSVAECLFDEFVFLVSGLSDYGTIKQLWFGSQTC